jgi:hypothetical protein
MKNFSAEGPLEEREIVHYADKRVMHDRIVSLEERMEDLVVRYGFTEEKKQYILKNREFTKTLEHKLQGFMTADLEKVISAI